MNTWYANFFKEDASRIVEWLNKCVRDIGCGLAIAGPVEGFTAAAAENDRLSAELAEARRALLAGNDTVLANKKLQEDNAALKARIAELEATSLHWTGEVARLTQNSCDDQDRAERAEARVAELEAREQNHIEVANRRLARAERAEAELDIADGIITSERARAERAEAERDSMRDMLKSTGAHLAKFVNGDDTDDNGELIQEVMDAARAQVIAARAALAPSPAGEKS